MKHRFWFLAVVLVCAASASADEITPYHRVGEPLTRIPGTTQACWSEPPVVFGGTTISSMKLDLFDMESEVANDFVFDHDTEIILARWWAGIW